MLNNIRFIHLALVLLCANALCAQTPIAEARELSIGSTVTIRGIVTNGSELGGIRHIQDATAGIAVFPGTGSISGFSPSRGTDISVTGQVKLFNGLLELDPVTAFTVHSTGNTLPAPQVIAPSGMGETTESELVRIDACAFNGAGGAFTVGTLGFTSNGQAGNIYLRSGHPLVGSPIPAGIVDIIGIVSQFSSATPPVGGYQLLPRTAPDLVPSNSIFIVGEVEQSSITSAGFTLGWNTNIAGNARVRYGLTAAMSSLASPMAIGTTHTAQLAGLLPAQAYYAQPYSVQGTDTAWAAIRLYSTASVDQGSVRVYFNKPVDESVAQGPLAIDLGSAMDDTLKAYMDRSMSTLDIAVYNTTSNLIVNAANDAHARGVRVRWIAEASNGNSALQGLNSGIGLLYRTNSAGSGMHNKFVIVDADGGPAAHVLTGSANFTNSGLFLDPNNLVVVNDMALARAYRMEFEEMWGSSSALPNMANSRFGGDKTDNTPHLFNVGGTLVQSWFSPSDGTTDRIDDALHSADERIEFALFVLTSSTLTEALIDLQAEPGVVVRGVVEEEDMNLGTFNDLLAGGVDVRTDGAASSLHHKYAIVDRGAPDADPLVITGSHNWSFNAENNNDENTLIIHSATIADQFHQEWNARWTTAVSVPDIGNSNNALLLWPNPSNTMLNVALDGWSGNAELYVVDASGRVVHSEPSAQATHTLDVKHFAPGVYNVVVLHNGERWTRTFLRMP